MHHILLAAAAVVATIGLSRASLRAQEPAAFQERESAREHLNRGRYAEAEEAYTRLLDASAGDVPASIGLARVCREQGNWERAEEVLAASADLHPDNADVYGQLARLHFDRGRYDTAEKSAQRALDIEPEHLEAKLIRARLQVETGKIKEAVEAFREFVRYYNLKQPTDADQLLLVAEGSIEYARAKSVSQIFNFVVNQLTPDALRADPACWRAHLAAGNLLLEKYNSGQAVQEFNKALAINPQAAEVLAALGRAAFDNHDFQGAADFADRALVINPRTSSALLLAADVALAADEASAALQFAERAAAVDASSQSGRARLAAADLAAEGIPALGISDEFLKTARPEPEIEGRRFVDIYRELVARNPAPGQFLTDLGEYFEQERRWESASRCYSRAIEVAPQLSRPRTSLGLLKMRTGDLAAARTILDDAFKADPYHVRVSNMRKVLGVLEGYETLTTEHFLVRYSLPDRLQAECLAEYLEEVYPELTKEFGYEPPSRTPFELYSSTRGQSAHAWFSARMIGLPWIQTIGASTGMIVALASPTAAREKYDWARVVKHEFSHVLTLQETGFAIPHWYTEALAVRTEGHAFPDDWRRILKERRRRDELFTLETLNQGFQRPRNGDDWQCAYCLSRLYARCLEETWGADSLFQLVRAYRDGLKTDAAIRKVTGCDPEEFETRFRTFLDGVIVELDEGRAPEMPSPDQAKADWHTAPDDPDAQANHAWALLNAAPLGQAKTARQLAERALEADPRQPIAHAILARLELRARHADEARTRLQDVFDPDSPNAIVVGLLGRLYLDEKKYEEAAEVFEAGLRCFPAERGWTRALAVADLRLGRDDQLPALMESVAAHDPDDVSSRQWLLSHAAEEGRWEDAVKWGIAAMHIDVNRVETHRTLGQAYLELGQFDRARRHLDAALTIDPQDEAARALQQQLSARPG